MAEMVVKGNRAIEAVMFLPVFFQQLLNDRLRLGRCSCYVEYALFDGRR